MKSLKKNYKEPSPYGIHNKYVCKMKKIAYLLSLLFVLSFSTSCHRDRVVISKPASPIFEGHHYASDGKYYVVDWPTENKTSGGNKIQGIILHHTATSDIKTSLRILTNNKANNRVSCHVLIDKDGTRYVLAEPEDQTWHAGYSRHNGKDGCNTFMIGIEFQGNTASSPLTNDQIESAIDYMIPMMKKYGLNEKDIVTHKQVRDEWLKCHTERKDVPQKGDITDEQYDIFMKELKSRIPL